MDVEGISVLSVYLGETQRHVPDRHFIVKMKMTMRWRGVGGEEVGVKCACIQGCCVCARPGVKSCWVPDP